MTEPTTTPHALFVIGASAGGVGPLLGLAAQLPETFDGSIVVVLHIDAHDSHMPALMNFRGKVHASYATEGGTVERGRIYFAAPDHHLILDGTRMRLLQGPKENFTRPAIDPLFRSAALTWQGPLTGVILSGMLDDGAVGLKAIERQGGVTVVQEPGDADMPSMPRAALAAVNVDHRVRASELGALLVRLLESSMSRVRENGKSIDADEHGLTLRTVEPFSTLARIGEACHLTCPDCGGSLWKLLEQRPQRYRCHTGHAFTLRALEHAQARRSSDALEMTLRTLVEKRVVLLELSNAYGPDDEDEGRAQTRTLLDSVERAITVLRELAESLPGSVTRVLPDDPST